MDQLPPDVAAEKFKSMLDPLDRPLSDAVRVEDISGPIPSVEINTTPPKDLSTAYDPNSLDPQRYRQGFSQNEKEHLDADWEIYRDNIPQAQWNSLTPAQQQELEYSHKYYELKAIRSLKPGGVGSEHIEWEPTAGGVRG